LNPWNPKNVYFQKSTDRGATWSAPIKVNSNTPVWDGARDPAIAVSGDGQTVRVLWNDDRLQSNVHHVYFAKSTNGGASFNADVRVDTFATGTGLYASVLTVNSGGVLFAAWTDYIHSYLSRSTDGGATWSAPAIRIDDSSANAVAPTLAVNSTDNPVAAWVDQRLSSSGNIYFAKSTDGGLSFQPGVRIDDSAVAYIQEKPRIAVTSAGTIYVMWLDRRNNQHDVYTSFSTDGGSTWSPNQAVAGGPAASEAELGNLRFDSAGNPAFTWGEPTSWMTGKVTYVRSTDGGLNYLPSLDIVEAGSNVPAKTMFSDMVFGSDDTTYVIWEERIPIAPNTNNYHIFFTRTSGKAGFCCTAGASCLAEPVPDGFFHPWDTHERREKRH
jgi:hypothetical protein